MPDSRVFFDVPPATMTSSGRSLPSCRPVIVDAPRLRDLARVNLSVDSYDVIRTVLLRASSRHNAVVDESRLEHGMAAIATARTRIDARPHATPGSEGPNARTLERRRSGIRRSLSGDVLRHALRLASRSAGLSAYGDSPPDCDVRAIVVTNSWKVQHPSRRDDRRSCCRVRCTSPELVNPGMSHCRAFRRPSGGSVREQQCI